MSFALAGIIVTAATAVLGASAALWARRRLRSRLDLVDLDPDPPHDHESSRSETFRASGTSAARVDDGGVSADFSSVADQNPVRATPVLDVKVRNLGGQPAMIKSIKARVEERITWRWEPPAFLKDPPSSAIVAGPSASYTVAIPDPWSKEGSEVAVPVSQLIRAGDGDRFQLELTMPSSGWTVFYLLRLTAIYDGNDRRLELPSVALAYPASLIVPSISKVSLMADLLWDEWRQIKDMIVEVQPGIRGVNRFQLPSRIRGRYRSRSGSEWLIPTIEFDDPHRAISSNLASLNTMCRNVIGLVSAADIIHPAIDEKLGAVKALAGALPGLVEKHAAAG